MRRIALVLLALAALSTLTACPPSMSPRYSSGQ